MRPVNRGNVPSDPANADCEITFSDYKDARDHLTKRIGDFCSYCESGIQIGIHVEHIQPRVHHPGLQTSWSNLILACTHCNSIKGDADIALDDYFWPHLDNTYRAFEYWTDAVPKVAAGLNLQERCIAENTLKLTGLDRCPGHPQFSERDLRWLKRREAWGMALTARKSLAAQPTEEMRRQILQTALCKGFWSVWMAVFADDPQMQQALVRGFPGTAADECFDSDGRPMYRPQGKI